MQLQVGVKLCIKDRLGKILLLRRSPEKYPDIGGMWDIPGGRIDTGKTLFENLKREVKEETGFTLKNNVQLVSAQAILLDSKKHVVRLTYVAKVAKRPKIQLHEEHDEFKWFDIKELRKMSKREFNMFFTEVLNNGLIK